MYIYAHYCIFISFDCYRLYNLKENCVLDVIADCSPDTDAAVIDNLKAKLNKIRDSLSCVTFPGFIVSLVNLLMIGVYHKNFKIWIPKIIAVQSVLDISDTKFISNY